VHCAPHQLQTTQATNLTFYFESRQPKQIKITTSVQLSSLLNREVQGQQLQVQIALTAIVVDAEMTCSRIMRADQQSGADLRDPQGFRGGLLQQEQAPVLGGEVVCGNFPRRQYPGFPRPTKARFLRAALYRSLPSVHPPFPPAESKNCSGTHHCFLSAVLGRESSSFSHSTAVQRGRRVGISFAECSN